MKTPSMRFFRLYAIKIVCQASTLVHRPDNEMIIPLFSIASHWACTKMIYSAPQKQEKILSIFFSVPTSP